MENSVLSGGHNGSSPFSLMNRFGSSTENRESSRKPHRGRKTRFIGVRLERRIGSGSVYLVTRVTGQCVTLSGVVRGAKGGPVRICLRMQDASRFA